MPSTALSKSFLCFLTALLLELIPGGAITVRSEQLPIKAYTTADGLARDDINQIFRDSRGFLWFSTDEGLSRFDGYRFVNYTTQDGLPSRRVNGLLETHAGDYWVATGAGVCRFNSATNAATTHSEDRVSAAAPMFVCYRPHAEPWSARVLFEDHAGVIWCGAGDGLYRLEAHDNSWLVTQADVPFVSETPDDRIVEAIAEGAEGGLWIGTVGSGLYQRQPDGHAIHYTVAEGLPSNRVETLLADKDGYLWAGTAAGLSEIKLESGDKRAPIARTYTTRDGLAANWIHSLLQTAQGQLWVGTTAGLSKLGATTGAKPRFNSYTERNGLSRGEVISLGEDRDGNLWIGMNGGGALKLAHNGFTTFSQSDGLTIPGASSIFENQAGALCVISLTTASLSLRQFDGANFNDITPRFPKAINYFGWGWNQYGLQDRAGEWWLPTGHGLFRFAKVVDKQLRRTSATRAYTSKDGLPLENVFRLFEDSHGNIWISTVSPARNGLTLWERETDTLRTFSSADGWPNEHVAALSFVEDAAGTVWIGTNGSQLLRYRAGRFDSLAKGEGSPAGWLRALYLDHSGRLWIAASPGGLGRIDNPMAERPTVVSVTTADGLLSNDLWCITEDRRGRLYVGSGRGVDRLEPESRRVKHYTAADGLFRGEVEIAYRDQTGTLWFGSPRGLARFVPESEESTQPAPPIFINSLRIAGESVRLAELGATEISGLELGANRSPIQIDFVALDFGAGEMLRYQYKLEGADSDWSAPTDQRSINFAHLPAGAYRFLVRAIDAEGRFSTVPATVAFKISPPFYRQWWFIGLLTLLVGGLAYVGYRYRLAQLLALERVRTRIATDLHDDIGSNLTKISILSEVARQQIGSSDAQRDGPLASIARISRESVAAMSDIVWAINPQRDNFGDVIRRMRLHAEETCLPGNINLIFLAPQAEEDLRLGVDTRRDLYLVFKEAVNNAVRHSGCTRLKVALSRERDSLSLHISDNGQGFDPRSDSEGNGLQSMQKRADSLGGKLEIQSRERAGTTVLLRFTLASRVVRRSG
jgi:ligand-binding sensor domain-containing protein/two-component sensor histidine kinase